MKWYLIVVLICISLIVNIVDHFFICLLAIYMSSLEKSVYRSAHFFVWVVWVFLYWGIRAVCWKLSPCLLHLLQIFSPFHRLSFHVVNGVFLLSKSFYILLGPICLVALVVKILPANAVDTKDTSSVHGLGRSPGERNG